MSALTLVSHHPFLCASWSPHWVWFCNSQQITRSPSRSHRQHSAISGIKEIIAYDRASHSAKSPTLSLAGYLQTSLKFWVVCLLTNSHENEFTVRYKPLLGAVQQELHWYKEVFWQPRMQHQMYVQLHINQIWGILLGCECEKGKNPTFCDILLRI